MRISTLPSIFRGMVALSIGLATAAFAQATPTTAASCVAGPGWRVAPDWPYAAVVSAGAIQFPSPLLRDNTSGACTSMFDLDPNGVPINIETRCNVSGIFVAHPEREEASRDMFAKVVNSGLSCTRFAVDGPASAGKWRTNVKRVVDFAINGVSRVAAPEEFARADPAPPITPEQATYFAEQRKKAAEAADAARAISLKPERSN